jgi:hypothetical protein
MKKISIFVFALLIMSNISFSQFKDIPLETKNKLKNNNLILGFINPNNFSIEHSFSMSYGTIGSSSVSIAAYTARLGYQLSKNMKLSADVTMQYSPFASLGSSNAGLNQSFQNSFNGINLSRVSFDWKISKNAILSFNYINNKNNYYLNNPNYGFFGY